MPYSEERHSTILLTKFSPGITPCHVPGAEHSIELVVNLHINRVCFARSSPCPRHDRAVIVHILICTFGTPFIRGSTSPVMVTSWPAERFSTSSGRPNQHSIVHFALVGVSR